MILDWGWFCHLPKDIFWLSSFTHHVTVGKRPGMLLNVLQGTEQPSTTKNCSVQNIRRVKLRNPCLKKWQYLFCSGICNFVRAELRRMVHCSTTQGQARRPGWKHVNPLSLRWFGFDSDHVLGPETVNWNAYLLQPGLSHSSFARFQGWVLRGRDREIEKES